ncbi:MAG: alpha-amylase/4-alpha-glucanotransferase domain-containing protein, partial [Campylobacterota bacterium]|nr:alpha-amylase/4-alpha-glucanotransferase domain-containing protein [Campylobacterota bacterium]
GSKRYEEDGVKFLKGGIWKNFFVKYEESNRIHKRMLELSKVRLEVNNPAFDTALYKFQTNDALWHGVFGGLYLPNLRDNAYRYMIEAEDLRYGKKLLIETDRNELDGYNKVKVVTPKYIFRFDSANGGQLVEFDSRKACFNWQNTLTRRKEAYHQHILNEQESQEEDVVEDGIDTIHNSSVEIDDNIRNSIIYDWHLKNSFIDHISDDCFCSENFRYANFHEYGDFANQPFDVKHNKSKITFSRQGGLYFPQKERATLKKSYLPKNCGFDFEINLSTDVNRTLNYVLEYNFHFAEYEKIKINGEKLAEDAICYQTNRLEIYDLYLNQKIIIKLNQMCDIYYFPLKTLSQSEKGFDLSVQGISIAMVLPFTRELSLNGSLEVRNV